MKKLYVYKEEIFAIAKIIKLKFPDKKFHLHLNKDNKLIIKLPKNVDYFQKEELKTLIKIKYPQFQLNFEYNF